MSDPAVEAAQRALNAKAYSVTCVHAAADAAREALKPIREGLSEAIQVAASGTTGTTHETISGLTKDEALEIMAEALLAVRPLLYTTEELER